MSFRLLLVAIAAAVTLSLHAGDLDEVRRLDGELAVATWTADALWFDRNLADDYTLVTPAGTFRTKKDVIAELSTPGLRMDPFEPAEVTVRVHGETAVVTGRMLQRFSLGRVRYANHLRYTDVYVKQKGQWILVAGHISNLAMRR